MKCRECPDYAKCAKESNLTIKQKNCSKAKTEKVKTNADKIRDMTDDGLADWLARTQIANVAEALSIAKIPYETADDMHDAVKKECLEWLQQPAEQKVIKNYKKLLTNKQGCGNIYSWMGHT